MQYNMQYSLSSDNSAALLNHSDHMTPRSSLLDNILPNILKKRLAPISSIRTLASTYIRPGQHRRTNSDSSDTSTASPPPPYTEEPLSSDDEEDMDDTDFTSAPSSRPSTSGSASPLVRRPNDILPPDSLQGAENLIRFKFANHGLLLVAQSAQESRSSVRVNDEYQRRLYLDGITYLLRGLPDELNDEERTKLHAALPTTLKDTPRDADGIAAATSAERARTSGARIPYLRLIVQTIVFWIFLAFATALPYLKYTARSAYAFERRHKVGEQFLAQTLALAQLTSSQVLAFICTIWTMNDGIVGRTLTEIGAWCAQNVGEGVRDGLTEAAAALRRTHGER